MMQELKRCFKLLRYAYGLKGNITGTLGLFIIAVLCTIGGSYIGVMGYMVSAVFMFISFVMIVQLKDNYLFSGMVMASGRKRCLEIILTDIIVGVGGLASYLLHAVLVIQFVDEEFLQEASLATILIITGITIAIFIVYYGFSNKFYGFALVSSFFCYFFLDVFGNIFMKNKIGSLVGHNTGYGLLAGSAIVVVGIILSMIVRRMLYKKAASVHMGSVGLRKAMQ